MAKDNSPEKKEMTEFFITNIVLNTWIKKLTESNLTLKKRLENLENGDSLDSISYTANGNRKKRKRKLKKEVDRNFRCSFKSCNKAYG